MALNFDLFLTVFSPFCPEVSLIYLYSNVFEAVLLKMLLLWISLLTHCMSNWALQRTRQNLESI